MDRREFIEALSGLLLAANAPYQGKACTLSNGDSGTAGEPQSRRLLPLPSSVSGVLAPVVGPLASCSYCGAAIHFERYPRHPHGPMLTCRTSSRRVAIKFRLTWNIHADEGSGFRQTSRTSAPLSVLTACMAMQEFGSTGSMFATTSEASHHGIVKSKQTMSRPVRMRISF